MTAPWWWRYAIPNIVTSASLVAGLLAISAAITGDYQGGAWFILLSVALDKLDGTVARLLHSSSTFGLQMDSLADLVAFGVAPAVLVLSALMGDKPIVHFEWWRGLRYLSYVGIFWFVIASALRLAKFNVLSENYGKDYFFGIPTTVCGAFVAILFLVATRYPILTPSLQLLPATMLLLGFLMVSRVPRPKIKRSGSIAHKIWVFGHLAATYTCVFARTGSEYLLFVAVEYVSVGTVVAMIRGIKAPPLPRPGEKDASTDA